MTTADSPSSTDLSRLALELYEQSVHGAVVRSSQLLVEARRVTRWLGWMACVQTLLTLAIWITVNDRAGATPLQKLMGLSVAFLAAMFWVLWLWSKESPLAPAVAGLTIYTTLWWTTAAYTLANLERSMSEADAIRIFHPDLSTLIHWMVVGGLVRAVIAGAKHRKLTRQLAAAKAENTSDHVPFFMGAALLPLEPQRRRLAGITSSILFYFMLVWVILDLIMAWGDSLLTPVMYQKLVLMEVIIILTWSIASWRDVYRPIVKAINPLWYLAAVGVGFCTFAMSTGWMHLVRNWADLPSPDASLLTQGQSWWMQLLLVAVTPAIVEEIAFRGVIFGAFIRNLQGWETVIVTALMFMVLHTAVPSFPHLLIMGLILGYLRLRTGSWLPGVFLHFTHNFLCLLTAS